MATYYTHYSAILTFLGALDFFGPKNGTRRHSTLDLQHRCINRSFVQTVSFYTVLQDVLLRTVAIFSYLQVQMLIMS